MKPTLSRRSFLGRTALVAGGLTAARFLGSPNILAASNSGEKLKCVVIGCGGRGMTHLGDGLARTGQIPYAIVDPDEKRHAVVKKWMQGRKLNADNLQVFTDYRVMFDKIGKEIDAVFIASPNHQHALPAVIAMQLGKAVYCETPVCHDVAEERKLREWPQSKEPTQMGNQATKRDTAG